MIGMTTSLNMDTMRAVRKLSMLEVEMAHQRVSGRQGPWGAPGR